MQIVSAEIELRFGAITQSWSVGLGLLLLILLLLLLYSSMRTTWMANDSNRFRFREVGRNVNRNEGNGFSVAPFWTTKNWLVRNRKKFGRETSNRIWWGWTDANCSTEQFHGILTFGWIRFGSASSILNVWIRNLLRFSLSSYSELPTLDMPQYIFEMLLHMSRTTNTLLVLIASEWKTKNWWNRLRNVYQFSLFDSL